MYAKGMSTRDISDIVKGIYGFDISAEMVSNITDRVVDDLAERQNRPLKAMYSFMFVDCMHVNVKRERRSEKHAVYVALAYGLDGHKDVLDLWVGESEGKHFWMGVFDELHRRGIRRISTISETSRPRRNIRPIDAAKKKEGRNAPPSGQPVSRLPACQFALPETIGALWGSNPSAWRILSRPCPLCVSRTPRQTSGLPAGAEPSFEDKGIIASTNPKYPAIFEDYRENGLHP